MLNDSPGPNGSLPPRSPRSSDLSIAYSFSRRMMDRWHGWRDGRKGIPELPAANVNGDNAPHGPGTPTKAIAEPGVNVSQMHSMLTNQAQQEVAAVRKTCVEACVESSKRHDAALNGLGALRERVSAALNHRDAIAKPDTTEAPRRRSFEEGREDLTEDTVWRRRLADHRREYDRADAAYNARWDEFNRARSAAAAHQKDIDAECQAAAHRARAYWHHYQIRRSVYSQQLVRTHPEGKRLNQLLQQAEPDLPAWVDDPRLTLSEQDPVDDLDSEPREW